MNTITQRELRNDNADVVRRVEKGERLVVTRRGVPVADLVPHEPANGPAVAADAESVLRAFADLPPVDAPAWIRDMRAVDIMFVDDDRDAWSTDG